MNELKIFVVGPRAIKGIDKNITMKMLPQKEIKKLFKHVCFNINKNIIIKTRS